MPEDDAMDLNDEGVRPKVVALYTECCGFLRAGDQWPEGAMHSSVPHDHTPVLRLVALRAVPESDELVRLRAALKSIVDRHPDSPLGEHPAVDIARAALFPVACDE